MLSTLAYMLLFVLTRGWLGAQAANLVALLVTAIGNTAANAFGATYPGAGATIAQGLVYGYIAAVDAAEAAAAT